MTETSEFASMMRRMLTAWVLRVAGGDTYDLAELVEFQRDLERAIGRAVREARATQGRSGAWSWSAIGDACGISRQAAQQRWGRGKR